ncbi:MAG: GDP-mannose 4,6-dehydratase [Ferruginibacter sp.]
MQKAIIFGAAGQDGIFLRQLLENAGLKVIGVSRSAEFLKTDISNYAEVSALIQAEQPEYIFHLAANSTTGHEALFENHQTIATGSLNILEAVKNFSPSTKVFISGSGLQFLNRGLPIKETDPFEANDAYSISRIQNVYAARYFRSLGLKVYVGYFFNHDSELRSERHVTKKISETVKRIAAGSDEILQIGDMSVIKEWSYAGDIVKGIWLLVNQEKVFEANISSGEGHSIEEWIVACFNIAGVSPKKYITGVPGFISGYRKLVSDNTLIRSLGYQPAVSFPDLAKMMMQA